MNPAPAAVVPSLKNAALIKGDIMIKLFLICCFITLTACQTTLEKKVIHDLTPGRIAHAVCDAAGGTEALILTSPMRVRCRNGQLITL